MMSHIAQSHIQGNKKDNTIAQPMVFVCSFNPKTYDTNSTFAWFKASTAATASTVTPAQTLTVSDPSYTATSVTLPLVVTVTAVGDNASKPLELATWDTSALKGGYYGPNATDPGETVTDVAAPKTGNAFWRAYKIGVHVDSAYNSSAFVDDNGDNWSATQIVNALKTQKAGFALAQDTGSRAKFFSASKDTQPNAAAEGATTASVSAGSGAALTLLAAAANTSSDVVIGYFGIYVEGSGSIDSGTVSGDFVVTVTSA